MLLSDSGFAAVEARQVASPVRLSVKAGTLGNLTALLSDSAEFCAEFVRQISESCFFHHEEHEVHEDKVPLPPPSCSSTAICQNHCL